MLAVENLKIDSYSDYSEMKISDVLLKILSDKLDSTIVTSILKVLIKIVRFCPKESHLILQNKLFASVSKLYGTFPESSSKTEYHLFLLLMIQLTRSAVDLDILNSSLMIDFSCPLSVFSRLFSVSS